MQFTRRYWVTVALVAVLAGWAALLERPLALVGAAGVAAWLVVYQYRFLRAVGESVAALDVDLTVDRSRVSAEERTAGHLSVRSDRSTELSIRVSADAPVGADSRGATCHLPPGAREADAGFEVAWPVAGAFEFDRPTLSASDPLGLFGETATVGPAPTVTVEPRAPSDIHVGESGRQLLSGFGDHATDATDTGFTPAEVRRYLPGDSVRQMDWKATARLAEPHVREFEGETDVETGLLVDHRETMGAGRAGERKLDFARQVALALAESTRRSGDPLACLTVGDEGLTGRYGLGTGADHHRAVAARLRALDPTPAGTDGNGPSTVSPARAEATATRLDGDSPFDRRLRPFFETTSRYVERVTDRPLFAGTREWTARRAGTARTIIVTDDERRTELLEAVKLARAESDRVVVYLTPTALYDEGGLETLETAYERYAEFERFRRQLAALGRVSAFEVGPADRLERVLAAGRDRRRVGQ
ncbi:DUF58 domain-containing protein [Haloarcula onubensis]|uniref:DUF58 domain-containing protein n=1 Tax=Haloarcula onubensis TaxID=2950539 RepID=A0ABU2FKA0_9EURY|nr:DUF58 domain-containing protein [Halomicroarcula sp. S3CR25-11]MDS0280796.1 DUF58 domain-containing protein [Halomicroarcula sp. S3CR25-11]